MNSCLSSGVEFLREASSGFSPTKQLVALSPERAAEKNTPIPATCARHVDLDWSVCMFCFFFVFHFFANDLVLRDFLTLVIILRAFNSVWHHGAIVSFNSCWKAIDRNDAVLCPCLRITAFSAHCLTSELLLLFRL